MIRLFLPLLCAALGFAAASCGQSEQPLAPAVEAPASPHPQPPAAPSNPAPSSAEAPTTPASQPAADTSPDASVHTPSERRASTLIGMSVVSADGSPRGEVKDIIFDRQGRATHLVIAYGAEPQVNSGGPPNDGEAASTPEGKLTAMPWDAAMASIKEGRLVVESEQLQGAPSFTPDSWPDLDDPAWSAATDTYWRNAVRAAIAAHPGAPIDSTSRQRERPARDGDGAGG